MAKNQETTKNTIYTYLKSNGFDPQLKTTGNDDVDVMDKTDVIQFQFKLDDVNYGTASLSLDNEGVLKIYNSDKIANSPKQSEHGGKTWNQVIQDLRQMTFGKVKSFELDDMDNLGYDMAKRDHLKKIEEGYYPMGKKASYSDNVPECKIIIKHNRNIEEGEQRYRNIHQIFIENVMGERFLAPTTKPGLARVYARHIAEGGKVNDERWNHINSLCEEYSKMAGFVRATRNNQFNEDTQRLVEAGVNHYMSLRESLHKLAGKRGYNTYFESWSAPLMEGEGDEDLSEMFVNSSLDPRIESVIPILNRLNKNISENQEIKQVTELEEWADNIVKGQEGHKQEENGMAADSLKSIAKKAKRLYKTVKGMKDDTLEPWQQSKVTKADDYIDTVFDTVDADYDMYEQQDISEGGFEPHTAKFGKRILGHGKDWDEPMGHANIEIKINDRTWKIIRGAGPEGSQEWFDQKQKMRQMCKRKTESTGKEWKMYITGARPTAEGVAEGDVVAFKRPVSQPKTNQQPQNYHAALELASDWFWLEQGPMAHEMGTAKERKMQRLAAQKLVALKKLGYSVDWPLDDDFYGVDLIYIPTKQTWRIDADNLGESMQGVAEGHADQQRKIFKKNGKPVGEVGIDPEASPGNGNWYVKHYASGYDVVGFDSYEEAVEELKHCLKQGVAEAGSKAQQAAKAINMKKHHKKPKDVAEDIGPQQQAVGQLGATSKVDAGGKVLGGPERSKKGLRGKLVGANESVEPVLNRIKKLSGL